MADRFTRDEVFKPGVTYAAESFENSMFVPMEMRKREETYLNDIANYETTRANIPIPKDERAKAYYEQFINKTDSEIENITSALANKGSIDPSLASKMRRLKADYAKETGMNGSLGQLANLKKQEEDQYALRSTSSAEQNYSSENFQRAWELERNKIYDEQDWDNIGTDKFVVKNLQSNYAPKNVKLIDFYRENLDMLGSIGESVKQNAIGTPEVVGGTLVIKDQNGNVLTSTNQPNLQSYKSLITNYVLDENSDLMKAAKYRALGTDKENNLEAIQNDMLSQLHDMINSSTSINTEVDTRVNVTTAGQRGGGPSASTTTPYGEQGGEDSGFLNVTPMPSGHRDLPDSVLNNLGAYADGTVRRQFEAMEQSGDLKGMSPEDFAEAKNNALVYEELAKKRKLEIESDPVLKAKIYNESYHEGSSESSVALRHAQDKLLSPTGKGYDVLSGPSRVEHFKQSYNKAKKVVSESNNVIASVDPNNNLENVMNTLSPRILDVLVGYEALSKNQKEDQNIIVYPDGRASYVSKSYNDFGKPGVKRYSSAKELIEKRALEKGLKISDSNSFNKYVTAKLNKHTSESFISNVDTKALKIYNEELGKGTYKINSQEYILFGGAHMGEKQNKMRDDIDKALTLDASSILLTALNSGGLIDQGSGYVLMSDHKEAIKNPGAWANGFIEPKMKLKSLIDNGPGMKPEILLNVTYKDNNNKSKSMDISIPYSQSADNQVVENMFGKLETMVSPYDRAKIKALRDNAKTNFLYVDGVQDNIKGMSKNQKEKMLLAADTLEDSQLVKDPTYIQASPLRRSNVTKANMVYVPDDKQGTGFYKVNYVENGNNKVVTGSDYLFKSSIRENKANRTYGGATTITSEAALTKLSSFPEGKVSIVNKMIDFYSLMEAGVIKFEGYNPDTMTEFSEFKNVISGPERDFIDIDTKTAAAMKFYTSFKDKTILHKNRLELL